MTISKMSVMLSVVASAVTALACGTPAVYESQSNSKQTMETSSKPLPPGTKAMVVAGGCFWCLDSMFSQLKGVVDVESAYVGGFRSGVTYHEVCGGDTGHAEAVKVIYNPNEISETTLLQIFFVAHNPTTLNRQGPDSGTQYRSAIFYSTPEEKALAEKVMADIEARHIWRDKIVTTLEPIKNYTPAEEYHQHYYEKYLAATPSQRAMMNGGYCSAIIEPHVLEFKERFKKYLKGS